jgi:hypothetical protein
MSPDLKYLLLSTILCFVQVLIAATGANQQVGLPTLAGNREGLSELSKGGPAAPSALISTWSRTSCCSPPWC